MKKNKYIIIFIFVFLFIFNTNSVGAKETDQSNEISESLKKESQQKEVNNKYKETPKIKDVKNNSNETSDKSSSEKKSAFDKFLDSKLMAGILGGIISAVVNFVLYYINRKNAKAQLVFDIALKNLLPDVYMPLIYELKSCEYKGEKIRYAKIEKIIIDQAALIAFSPKEVKEAIHQLYITCKSIDSPESYKINETELVKKLKVLENKITDRFGALLG
ncbi:hypothetical protein [Priestia megaterium]|uniref:hypothetical protein n=1 Tax=Priestia megaterium TaxID=1404 RepID=UPI001F12BDFA|nr:hypothetical protein [Priestia megaterium]UMZ35527.1 hypothetical protein MGJ28_12900 [Priestia megaterium]